MPTILLIRHGENDYVGRRLAGRLPGVHLNEKGRKHAHEVAEALCNAPVKAIYSSPLERAMETAEPLAQVLGLPVLPRPGLQEIDFGSWQGKTMKQMARMKLWKVVQGSPSQVRFPGGESFSEAQQRMVAELEDIAAGHEPDDLIACFSHSDAIKLAVAHFLGMPLDNFQRLAVSTCALSIVHLPKEGPPHVSHINQVLRFEIRPPEEKKGKKREARVESRES